MGHHLDDTVSEADSTLPPKVAASPDPLLKTKPQNRQ
jgi:hypothetical protein